MSFQTQWSWDPSITPTVRREWVKRARTRYKDIIHLHRKLYEENNEYQPHWASTEAWREWVRAWTSPDIQASRQRGRRNRRRGNETGFAEVTHTGGSVSARRTLRILVYSGSFINLIFLFFFLQYLFVILFNLQLCFCRKKSRAARPSLMSCFYALIR